MATAELGHGTAGSGEATTSWPYWHTQRASMSHLEASARERRGDKELEQHGRCELCRRRSW